MHTFPVTAKNDDSDNCDEDSNSQQHCSPSKETFPSALRKHQAYRPSRDGRGTEPLGGGAGMEHRWPVLGQRELPNPQLPP